MKINPDTVKKIRVSHMAGTGETRITVIEDDGGYGKTFPDDGVLLEFERPGSVYIEACHFCGGGGNGGIKGVKRESLELTRYEHEMKMQRHLQILSLTYMFSQIIPFIAMALGIIKFDGIRYWAISTVSVLIYLAIFLFVSLGYSRSVLEKIFPARR